VCVCDADGAQSEAERHFLADVRTSLGLDAPAATQFAEQAEAIATTPLATGTAVAPIAAAATAATAAAPAVDNAELDQAILNAAILNGA
ncbi:GTPase, partial [Stenotrophomonas maltophilia]